MRNIKRIICIMLVVVMTATTFMPAFATDDTLLISPAPTYDFSGRWSEQAMLAGIENGIITGYEDGTYRPTSKVTRAEFAAIIVRAFGATVEKNINYTDVSSNDWFVKEIKKAVNMGLLSGRSETAMEPAAPITREEAFTAMARVLVLKDPVTTSAIDGFEDSDLVSGWAKYKLAALVERGYVNGDQGKINPLGNISREEFCQFMYNMISDYYGTSGTYENIVSDRCLMIRTPNVVMKNTVVNGDLILGDGVGIGDITLMNVTITGRLLVRGGEGVVTLTNVKTGRGVVVNDVNGTVNFGNYRTDSVFNVPVSVIENTPATYLQPPSGGGGGGGGGTTMYTVTFYDVDNDLLKTVQVASGKAIGSVFPVDQVDPDETLEREFAGWYDGDTAYTTTTIINKSVSLYPKFRTSYMTLSVRKALGSPLNFTSIKYNKASSATVTFNQLLDANKLTFSNAVELNLIPTLESRLKISATYDNAGTTFHYVPVIEVKGKLTDYVPDLQQVIIDALGPVAMAEPGAMDRVTTFVNTIINNDTVTLSADNEDIIEKVRTHIQNITVDNLFAKFDPDIKNVLEETIIKTNIATARDYYAGLLLNACNQYDSTGSATVTNYLVVNLDPIDDVLVPAYNRIKAYCDTVPILKDSENYKAVISLLDPSSMFVDYDPATYGITDSTKHKFLANSDNDTNVTNDYLSIIQQIFIKYNALALEFDESPNYTQVITDVMAKVRYEVNRAVTAAGTMLGTSVTLPDNFVAKIREYMKAYRGDMTIDDLYTGIFKDYVTTDVDGKEVYTNELFDDLLFPNSGVIVKIYRWTVLEKAKIN